MIKLNKNKERFKKNEFNEFKKEINDSIFLMIFFGGLSILANYPKTHSKVFVEIVISIVSISSLGGYLVIPMLKMNKNLFFLFQAITDIIIAGSLLSMCFTTYTVYLDLRINWYILVVIIVYLIVIIVSLLTYKTRTCNENKETQISKKKGTKVAKIGITFGLMGFFLGKLLAKTLNQSNIYIITMVIFFELSCVFIMVASINLYKYKLACAI